MATETKLVKIHLSNGDTIRIPGRALVTYSGALLIEHWPDATPYVSGRCITRGFAAGQWLTFEEE